MESLHRLSSFPLKQVDMEFIIVDDLGDAFMTRKLGAGTPDIWSLPPDGSFPVADTTNPDWLLDDIKHRCCSVLLQGASADACETPISTYPSQLRAMQPTGQIPKPEAQDYGSLLPQAPSHQFVYQNEACGGEANSAPAGVLNAAAAQAANSAVTSPVPMLPARPSTTTVVSTVLLLEEQADAGPPLRLQRDTRPALSSVCGQADDDTGETEEVEGGAKDDADTAATAEVAAGDPRPESSGCVRATVAECVSTASTCLAGEGGMSEVGSPEGEEPVTPELPVRLMSSPELGGALAGTHTLRQLLDKRAAEGEADHQVDPSLQEGGGEVDDVLAGFAAAVPPSAGAAAAVAGQPRRGLAPAATPAARAQQGTSQPRLKRAAAEVAAVVAIAVARDDAMDDEDFGIEQEQLEDMNNDDDDEDFEVNKRSAGAGAKRQKTGNQKDKTKSRLVTGAPCTNCGATQTPQWRNVGGHGHLCNACGVRIRKEMMAAVGVGKKGKKTKATRG